MDAMAIDQSSFERLYTEFHPRVLTICRRMLESHEEAQDAANDVFLRLPDAMKTYDPAQPFSRWISRVAGNYCIDLLRKRRAASRVLEPANVAREPAAVDRSPLEELLSREASGAVRDAIFSLPQHYLVPLVMRYFSDLSYDEIASTLGTSRAHIAVLIFRAKQQLRRVLASGEATRKQPVPKRTRSRLPQKWLWGTAPLFGVPF